MTKYCFLLVYVFIASCNEEIVVHVPDNFCGTVYVVSSKYLNVENEIIIDSNGIGYASSEIFNKNISPSVLCNMKDITDITINFASGVTNYNGNEIKYATLHVPCENEYNKSTEYWDMKEQERINTNELLNLIEDSIIKIDYLQGSLK